MENSKHSWCVKEFYQCLQAERNEITDGQTKNEK